MDSRFYKSGNRQCVLPERSKVTYNLEHLKIVVRLMYHGTRRRSRSYLNSGLNAFADLLSNKITSANSDSGQPAVDTAVSGLTAMRYSTAADKIPLQNLIKACKWFARKVRGVEAMVSHTKALLDETARQALLQRAPQ
ncbi:hypothetical protein HBH64_233310 [Parastagonospora nodorum]|nr:hypothetical protein HBH64_233310 [Parastagonospora nodorum]